MTDGNTPFAIAVVVINFLTMCIGFSISIYRENRRRRWDQEDRSRIAEELKADNASRARILADHTEKAKQELTQMIADNTAISSQAFTEANGLNEKLKQIGLERLSIERSRGIDSQGVDEERRRTSGVHISVTKT